MTFFIASVKHSVLSARQYAMCGFARTQMPIFLCARALKFISLQAEELVAQVAQNRA